MVNIFWDDSWSLWLWPDFMSRQVPLSCVLQFKIMTIPLPEGRRENEEIIYHNHERKQKKNIFWMTTGFYSRVWSGDYGQMTKDQSIDCKSHARPETSCCIVCYNLITIPWPKGRRVKGDNYLSKEREKWWLRPNLWSDKSHCLVFYNLIIIPWPTVRRDLGKITKITREKKGDFVLFFLLLGGGCMTAGTSWRWQEQANWNIATNYSSVVHK